MIDRYGMGAILNGKRGQELIAEVKEKKSCCKSKKVTLADLKSDYEYTAEEVEELDQIVFERIEKEKKARSNWRRLLTQIQIVKALSTRESGTLANRLSEALDFADEEEVKDSCWNLNWLDRYVQEPEKYFMVIWNLTAITVNTISIFIVYYECAFRMKSAII